MKLWELLIATTILPAITSILSMTIMNIWSGPFVKFIWMISYGGTIFILIPIILLSINWKETIKNWKETIKNWKEK